MNLNFKLKIKNFQDGMTLVEIIVVIFIISLFASIAFLNLPKIQGSFALSSAVYELAQNIRTAENNALTGVGKTSYVVSFDLSNPKQYSINGNSINIDKTNAGILIKEFDDETGKINNPVSITFTPPNPITTITGTSGSEVDIVLSLDSDPTQTKTVFVNTSGLIGVR